MLSPWATHCLHLSVNAQRIAMGLRPAHSSCPESHVIVVIWTIKNVVFILHVPWPKVWSSRTLWSSNKIWSQTSRRNPALLLTGWWPWKVMQFLCASVSSSVYPNQKILEWKNLSSEPRHFGVKRMLLMSMPGQQADTGTVLQQTGTWSHSKDKDIHSAHSQRLVLMIRSAKKGKAHSIH